MRKDIFGLPDNPYGWVSIITGLLACGLYATQMIYDWFGIDESDKILLSFIVLTLLCLAIANMYVGNNYKTLRNPMNSMIKIFISVFVLVLLFIIIINGVAMNMSTEYTTYVNTKFGFFTGIRNLTQVTQEDLTSLQNWALGLKQIIKALFLIVPFLIATWGGLSVLTADSIDEAEGGILAIVAAFIVVIVVWLFKLVEITLS